MFDIVKQSYDFGLYTKDDVAQMVPIGFITADDYKTITGDEYIVPAA